MEDARPLDELAHDPTPFYVLHNNSFHASGVDTIIQRRGATRARQRRKPRSERGLVLDQLAYEDVGALRATPKTALPGQLGRLAKCIRFERRTKHLVQRARRSSIAALRAAADHDLEATSQGTRAYSPG